MSCILFMDTEKAERMRKAKELDAIFRRTVREGKEFLRADRCTLWMLSDDGDTLWTRTTGENEPPIVVPATSGLVGAAVATKQLTLIPDCYSDPRFNRQVDKDTSYTTRNMITAPIVAGNAHAPASLRS